MIKNILRERWIVELVRLRTRGGRGGKRRGDG